MDTEVRASGPPIGFNLPEEFRERVTISQGQNLYPPLNAGTAGELKKPLRLTSSQSKNVLCLIHFVKVHKLVTIFHNIVIE